MERIKGVDEETCMEGGNGLLPAGGLLHLRPLGSCQGGLLMRQVSGLLPAERTQLAQLAGAGLAARRHFGKGPVPRGHLLPQLFRKPLLLGFTVRHPVSRFHDILCSTVSIWILNLY